MTFSITGHTRGFGKGMYERFGGLGFSKSTGYDITLKSDRRRILLESADCDVFINNAHSGYAQTELLYEAYHEWKDTNKIIINIGSRASEFTYGVDWNYPIEKASLMSLTKNLTLCDSAVRVTTLCFGYIGTDGIRKKYPELESYISVTDAVNYVDTVVTLLDMNKTHRIPYMLIQST